MERFQAGHEGLDELYMVYVMCLKGCWKARWQSSHNPIFMFWFCMVYM